MNDNFHYQKIKGLVESYKMGVTTIDEVMDGVRSSFVALSGKPTEIQTKLIFENDDESLHAKQQD